MSPKREPRNASLNTLLNARLNARLRRFARPSYGERTLTLRLTRPSLTLASLVIVVVSDTREWFTYYASL